MHGLMATRVFVVEEVVVDGQGRKVQGDRDGGTTPTDAATDRSERPDEPGCWQGGVNHAGTRCGMEAAGLRPVQDQRCGSVTEAAGRGPQASVQRVAEVYDVSQAAAGRAARVAFFALQGA